MVMTNNVISFKKIKDDRLIAVHKEIYKEYDRPDTIKVAQVKSKSICEQCGSENGELCNECERKSGKQVTNPPEQVIIKRAGVLRQIDYGGKKNDKLEKS